MEIGIDDLDDYVDGSVNSLENDTITQNITSPDVIEEPQNNDDSSNQEPLDIISELLKSKGIVDSSKIKFENDEGEIEEFDWKDLSDDDKLSILRSEDHTQAESDLDDAEIQLINTIRNSKMSPEEYVNYIQQQGINNYLQNSQTQHYRVDDLSDEELFVADLISKVGEDNITDEEIQSALDLAKQNESVFKKQISAIRNEYKQLEDKNIEQTQNIEKLQLIESFNKFAESVENEIRSFTEIQGYSLNMDESEMEELYDFITGFDDAGVSIFGKVLNNPKTLVSMAWFALNGEKALQDINDYWTKEITLVRKNSYNQGIEDYKNGKIKRGSNVEIRPLNNKSNSFHDDLDDF